MVKFIGPAYECFYVPQGKTACFNSLGELETEDKEVIAVLSFVSSVGVYGVSIVGDKENDSEQKTQLEVNKSDEITTEIPVVEVTEEVEVIETPVVTEEVVEKISEEVTEAIVKDAVADEIIAEEEVSESITEEVTDTATLTDGVKKRKAK